MEGLRRQLRRGDVMRLTVEDTVKRRDLWRN